MAVSKQNPIQLTKTVKAFTDISLDFQPNALTGDLSILVNERAINNSIRNIIQISPREVVFRSDVGSTVRDYLFDLVDDATAGLLTLEIERTLAYNEPRIEVEDVQVSANIDSNAFDVRIQYKIVGYDQSFNVSQILIPTT